MFLSMKPQTSRSVMVMADEETEDKAEEEGEEEEEQVMVRLKGEDLREFKIIKAATHIGINAEVLRVVMRIYFIEHHQEKPKSTP